MHQRWVSLHCKTGVPPIIPRFEPILGIVIGKEQMDQCIIGGLQRKKYTGTMEGHANKKGQNKQDIRSLHGYGL